MNTAVGSYIHKLFSSEVLVAVSAVGACLHSFFFPEQEYLCGALAVLGIMVLDLITKLFALYRQAGGSWKQAFKSRSINSHSFSKGTIDKLIVFGVMLIICGCAYRLTIVSEIAVWMTQLVFTLMFLRDVLSILENLSDAGIDVGIFKKAIQKKMDDYVDNNDVSDTTSEDSSDDGDTPI